MAQRQPDIDGGINAALLEGSPDCVKVLDLDGRLQAMNRNGQCALHINDFAELRGRAWTSLWPEESRAQVAEAVGRAREGEVARFNAFCPTAQGVPKWWDVTVTPIADGGPPSAILSVSRDITELHEAREEQRETATRLRFVLDAAQIGDWEIDLTTGKARTSLIHDQCFGFTEPVREWSYDAAMERIHPDDRARVIETVRAALSKRQDWDLEARVVWPDGSLHWLQAVGSFYRGSTARMLGTVRDITTRRNAEEQLREARERAMRSAREAKAERRRLDALLGAAPVGILYADASGRLVAVNTANAAIWGEQRAADRVEDYVQWQGWWADDSPRHGEPIQPDEWAMARALRGEEVRQDIVEIEPFDAPGTRKTLLLQASPVHDSDGHVSGAVTAQMDITDRVRIEAELRESEARFRTITDAMPQMVWSCLPDGSADYYNRQWYEFIGREAGSTDCSGWRNVLHPDDREVASTRWRHSLETGQDYEIEFRLRHHSGEYRWVLGRALPVRDDGGRILRWMGTCTDIHEQKLARTALEQSEESLRQADRRKDEFLAMLAHELRNPLAPITSAAELLRMPARDEKRIAQASAIISRQVRHMTELVDDLLDVSRVTRGVVSLDLEDFDLKIAIGAAIEQVRPLIEERHHTLSTRVDAAALWVHGDRTRLTQVVANLLNNAAKYTPPHGRILLEAGALEDGSLRISVTDNGSGIDPRLMPDLFSLFSQGERRPDRAQGGLGIGLALVKSLAALHGGEVTARSDGVGRGSTFTLTLPRAVRELGPAAPAADAHESEEVAPLHVVVVDDNVDAAQSLTLLLELYGHRVSMFHSGEAALAALRPNGADAYILDIGLPGMTGHELARTLRGRENGERALILALSGYGHPQDRQASSDAGVDEHFVKPPDPGRLLERLERHQQSRAGPWWPPAQRGVDAGSAHGQLRH